MEEETDRHHHLETRVSLLEREVASLWERIKDFVTRAEHAPIRWIVYSGAAAVMSAVLAGILSLVIRK